MTEILYLVVGVAVGVALCPALQYFAFRLKEWKKPKQAEFVDESLPVQCGACRNIILEPPVRVVISDTANFKLYVCRQCSTHVTVAI